MSELEEKSLRLIALIYAICIDEANEIKAMAEIQEAIESFNESEVDAIEDLFDLTMREIIDG